MKFLITLSLVVVAVFLQQTTVNAQNADETFVEYLHRLQEEAQFLHVQFESSLENSRYLLSFYNDILTRETLTRLLGQVEAASTIRQTLLDYATAIETDDPSCVALLLSEFNFQYDMHGFEMRACSSYTQQTILQETNAIHALLDSWVESSRESQNAVLTALVNWNPIMHDEELHVITGAHLTELYEFYETLLVELEAAYDSFGEASIYVPNEMERCTSEIVGRLRVIAEAAELQAWLCGGPITV